MNRLEGKAPVIAARSELSAFLRKKRSELDPAWFGIARVGQRRTKGLRREDIAHLAHVSLSWYTWLEQGKPIKVSAQLLGRLARTLKLSNAETRYLYSLCDHRMPDVAQPPEGGSQVSIRLIAMLNSIAGPAFFINRRWDVLSANRAAEAVFGIQILKADDDLNILELIFLNDDHRKMMPNWERDARLAVAKFRLDVTESLPEDDLLEWADELRNKSSEFAAFWAETAVSDRVEDEKFFHHPKVGLLNFGYTHFHVSERPELRLNVYTAADAETERKMALLYNPPIIP